METEHNSAKYISRQMRELLAGLYPEQEISQLIYILFDEYLGWDRATVHLNPDVPVSDRALDSMRHAAAELATGKPIQYIIGKTRFCNMTLLVNEHVLIPRPETEQLCEMIKQDLAGLQHQNFAGLDIGTGSGCIAIGLKSFFRKAGMDAIDISAGAIEMASINAAANRCEITFSQADILDKTGWDNFGKYDLIVSNPPYVLDSEKALMHKNVMEFEPARALFVRDQDPLVFYRAIAAFAAEHLEGAGCLYVEINEKFGKEICDLVGSHGFNKVETLHDFHGKARFVKAKR